jgi:hypothetical protein
MKLRKKKDEINRKKLLNNKYYLKKASKFFLKIRDRWSINWILNKKIHAK